MLPTRARLASATAAGVVGLAVAGLILFGTDPLGTASTVIAVPASATASGDARETGSVDEPTATPTRRPVRPSPTDTTSETPRSTYRTAPARSATHRSRPTYEPQPLGRPTRRATVRPRPTPSTAAPTATPTTPRPSAPAPTDRPSATPTPAEPSGTGTPTPGVPPSSVPPTPSASPIPTSASPAPSGDGYASRRDWAAAVLDRLNAQRAQHGLPALTSDARLTAAAHVHNERMADADQLSHQLPGEPGLGARIGEAGYPWSTVGENVAWTSNRSAAGVLALQDAMYDETPPDDGHRRNILGSSFTEVGIDVIEDPAHGKVWLVTDFGRP